MRRQRVGLRLMPVAGVLGSPIAHSLSPLLHRTAYRELGLTNWVYSATECDADALSRLLADAGPDVVGYSCTMPLKRAVLEVAHSVSEVATAIGAGNTLLQIDGHWHADNTDWIGIRYALADRGLAPTGRVALLGAGGTAQAVLAALDDDAAVTVLVRDPGRAGELLATAERLERSVLMERLSAVADVLADASLVVSTLPAAAADAVAAEVYWRADLGLLDVVYHPWPTALAHSALTSGASVATGAAMLLHQAIRQVELMTGLPVRQTPVEAAMRAALSAATALPDL